MIDLTLSQPHKNTRCEDRNCNAGLALASLMVCTVEMEDTQSDHKGCAVFFARSVFSNDSDNSSGARTWTSARGFKLT